MTNVAPTHFNCRCVGVLSHAQEGIMEETTTTTTTTTIEEKKELSLADQMLALCKELGAEWTYEVTNGLRGTMKHALGARIDVRATVTRITLQGKRPLREDGYEVYYVGSPVPETWFSRKAKPAKTAAKLNEEFITAALSFHAKAQAAADAEKEAKERVGLVTRGLAQIVGAKWQPGMTSFYINGPASAGSVAVDLTRPDSRHVAISVQVGEALAEKILRLIAEDGGAS